MRVRPVLARVRAGHADAEHVQGWSGYRKVKITR